MTQQAKPEGVSQYLWDRATGASPYGFNPTLITRDPATRDALVNAGYADFVKKAHESHMDQAAQHWSGNGATDDVYARANQEHSWYRDNYGAYSGAVQAPSGPAQSPRGPGGMFGGLTGVINNEVRPPEKPDYPGVKSPSTPDPSGPPQEPPVQLEPEAQQFDLSGPRKSTPFLDSYMRARESARATGPASSTMKKYME